MSMNSCFRRPRRRVLFRALGFAALLVPLFLAGPAAGRSGPPFALRLDGNDDRIEVRESRNLDFPGPFTIEAWIRPTDWGPDPEGGFARILDKSSYLLYLNRRGSEFMDRSVVLFLSLADGRGIGVGGPADAIALGVWTHVAVAYDGRSAVTMTIDGNPVPVFQPAGPPAGPVADASWSPLFIGDSPNRPRFFRGDIGPIRLWSSVRSPEAIAANRFRMDARGETLAAAWTMAEGEGAILTDAAGSGNDGDILGATWVEGPRPDADTDGDGDGDGIPDRIDPNQSPNAPVPVFPPDDLFPVDAWPLTLQAGPFSDPDPGDFMTAAQWRIAGEDGFHPPLFEVRTPGNGVRLPLPPLLLTGGAAYRWQVRYFDAAGDPSPWSAEYRFSTRPGAVGDESAGGGHPRFLAVDTVSGAGTFAVEISGGATGLEALDAFAPEAFFPPPPGETPMGLIACRFRVETPGGLAQLLLHPPAAVPDDAPWHARTGDGGWSDIGNRISPSPTETRILRIVDGGPDDLDGTANGRVIILLGPGAVRDPEFSPDGEEADGAEGGGGCFLESSRPSPRRSGKAPRPGRFFGR